MPAAGRSPALAGSCVRASDGAASVRVPSAVRVTRTARRSRASSLQTASRGSATTASWIASGVVNQTIGAWAAIWARKLAEGYGCGSRIVGIEVIATDARAAYADPGQVEDIVAAGALKLVSAGADVVVLCGAALSGMAAAFEGRVRAPVASAVA